MASYYDENGNLQNMDEAQAKRVRQEDKEKTRLSLNSFMSNLTKRAFAKTENQMRQDEYRNAVNQEFQKMQRARMAQQARRAAEEKFQRYMQRYEKPTREAAEYAQKRYAYEKSLPHQALKYADIAQERISQMPRRFAGSFAGARKYEKSLSNLQQVSAGVGNFLFPGSNIKYSKRYSRRPQRRIRRIRNYRNMPLQLAQYYYVLPSDYVTEHSFFSSKAITRPRQWAGMREKFTNYNTDGSPCGKRIGKIGCRYSDEKAGYAEGKW